MSKNTVKRYLRRIAEKGYCTESVLELDDKTLAQIVDCLGKKRQTGQGVGEALSTDGQGTLAGWGVTRMRLCEEYRQEEPGGYRCHKVDIPAMLTHPFR